jgi:hypothetical protein
MRSHLFLFAFYRQLQTSQFAVRPTGVVLVVAASVQDGVEFVVAVNFVEQPYNVFAEFVRQRAVLGLETGNIDKCTDNTTRIRRKWHCFLFYQPRAAHLLSGQLMRTIRTNVQLVSIDSHLARN